MFIKGERFFTAPHNQAKQHKSGSGCARSATWDLIDGAQICQEVAETFSGASLRTVSIASLFAHYKQL